MPRGNEIPDPAAGERYANANPSKGGEVTIIPTVELDGLRETLHAQATRLAMHANTITQLRRRVRELEAELAGVGR